MQAAHLMDSNLRPTSPNVHIEVETFDTGANLLNRRQRASMEQHTATGCGLCAEHQKLCDDAGSTGASLSILRLFEQLGAAIRMIAATAITHARLPLWPRCTRPANDWRLAGAGTGPTPWR